MTTVEGVDSRDLAHYSFQVKIYTFGISTKGEIVEMSTGSLLHSYKISEEISERHLGTLIHSRVSIAKKPSHSVHNMLDSQIFSKAA